NAQHRIASSEATPARRQASRFARRGVHMSDPAGPTAIAGWSAYLGLEDGALLAQCDLDRFRASGPGGQKRNKTDSAVRLRHRPTGLQGEATEERSQHLNRARALRRLRRAIALGLREPVTPEAYEPAGALAEALRRKG